MDHQRPHRPRVSRETRLLLITALLAVAALWGLARVRFADSSPPPNPVQPILTQLAGRPAFDDLGDQIAELRLRLQPIVVAIDGRPGVKVRSDAAVVLQSPAGADALSGKPVIGADPVSGLTLVRLEPTPTVPLEAWTTADARPRYLIAVDVTTGAPALQPVFVASLTPADSPIWPDGILLIPEQPYLTPGTFLFTTDALLAGVVVAHGKQTAVVPGASVLAAADALVEPRVPTPGYVGIRVQSLTPLVARATGASSGVVVTWVDPEGPAATEIRVGDVLESINGEPLPTQLHWDVRAARLSAAEKIAIRVHRATDSQDVMLTAAPAPQSESPPLGLTLQASAGGSLVARVEPGSLGDRAGIAAGDVITRFAEARAPRPATVRAAFARASAGEALLVAITRRDAHLIVAVEKP
jgi:hypothetical protein